MLASGSSHQIIVNVFSGQKKLFSAFILQQFQIRAKTPPSFEWTWLHVHDVLLKSRQHSLILVFRGQWFSLVLVGFILNHAKVEPVGRKKPAKCVHICECTCTRIWFCSPTSHCDVSARIPNSSSYCVSKGFFAVAVCCLPGMPFHEVMSDDFLEIHLHSLESHLALGFSCFSGSSGNAAATIFGFTTAYQVSTVLSRKRLSAEVQKMLSWHIDKQ